MDEGYEEDGGATIESLAGLYRFVRELLAERDRLRAVVDAAHELLDEDRLSWSPEHTRLAEALAALDESAAATDG